MVDGLFLVPCPAGQDDRIWGLAPRVYSNNACRKFHASTPQLAIATGTYYNFDATSQKLIILAEKMALLLSLLNKSDRLFWSGAICEIEDVFLGHHTAKVLQFSCCDHPWWVNYWRSTNYYGCFPYRYDLLLSGSRWRWKLVKEYLHCMLLFVDVHVTVKGKNEWNLIVSKCCQFRRSKIASWFEPRLDRSET